MPWLRKGPPKEHRCSLPEALPESEWYCPRCGKVWATKFASPAYDFINDRPMSAIWYWTKTGMEVI